MNTTYSLSAVRISNASIDRDGGLTPQYQCVINMTRKDCTGPIANCAAVVNYTEWADRLGFKITGQPDFGTRFDGLVVAEFPLQERW